MAAAAMELRRLGLASKILIVVPNDILQQFAEEFQHFYPLAVCWCLEGRLHPRPAQ